jgi:hypothetical protein
LFQGFNKEYLALTVLIDFPFQMLFGYYVAKWSVAPRPLKPVISQTMLLPMVAYPNKPPQWTVGFYLRLFFSAMGMFVVYIYPLDGVVTNSYLALVIVSSVLNSFAR